MKEAFKQIELTLTEWNPIEVPDEISRSEYMDYVPRLARIAADEIALVKELESILLGDIGLPYDRESKEHKSDLLRVARAIHGVKLDST